MRAESIGDRVWNSSNINAWPNPANLNTYLNEKYLGTLSDSDKIISHNFNIGSVTMNNNDLANQITDEQRTIWNGKIGLITLSEYLRANSNAEQCGTFYLYNDNYTLCKTTNWIFNTVGVDSPWTISPYGGNSSIIGAVNSNGHLGSNTVSNSNNGVVPVLYLTSDITLIGTGTIDDSYILSP